MARKLSRAKKGSGGGAAPGASTLLTEDDLYLFNEGSHFKLYEKLGSRLRTFEGTEGAHFAVWAPDASSVSVMGDFNDWSKSTHALSPRDKAGIWESFVPGVKQGSLYKYHLVSRHRGYRVDKADPFAYLQEMPPRTASVVAEDDCTVYRLGASALARMEREDTDLAAAFHKFIARRLANRLANTTEVLQSVLD